MLFFRCSFVDFQFTATIVLLANLIKTIWLKWQQLYYLLLLANFRHTSKSNASPRAQYDRLITSINTNLRQTIREASRETEIYIRYKSIVRDFSSEPLFFFTLHFSSSYRRRRWWDGRQIYAEILSLRTHSDWLYCFACPLVRVWLCRGLNLVRKCTLNTMCMESF